MSFRYNKTLLIVTTSSYLSPVRWWLYSILVGAILWHIVFSRDLCQRCGTSLLRIMVHTMPVYVHVSLTMLVFEFYLLPWPLSVLIQSGMDVLSPCGQLLSLEYPLFLRYLWLPDACTCILIDTQVLHLVSTQALCAGFRQKNTLKSSDLNWDNSPCVMFITRIDLTLLWTFPIFFYYLGRILYFAIMKIRLLFSVTSNTLEVAVSFGVGRALEISCVMCLKIFLQKFNSGKIQTR